jgi:catechol 2,3-dioxygenase-like lactoylglutathione lyase family enzyme
MLGGMTLQRMDNVAIVVADLDAAVAFFTELGMELEGKAQIEGLWADRTVGLDGVRSDIVLMRTPDGHSKLELTKYHTPAAIGAEPENPPPNTLGREEEPYGAGRRGEDACGGGLGVSRGGGTMVGSWKMSWKSLASFTRAALWASL